MPNPNITTDTSQYIDNKSFNTDVETAGILPLGFDGSVLRKSQTDLIAIKVTVVGDDTYVGKAPIGTAQAAASWQAFKVAVSGGTTTITWADGDAAFNNVASDLTSLSYS